MEETIKPQQPPPHPFLNIWIRPRETIRRIVDTNPELYVIPLGIISGIHLFHDNAASRSIGDSLPLIPILLIALVGGAISGIISL